MRKSSKEITVHVLYADADKVLTNGEAYSSVGGRVTLGAESNIDAWYEIDPSEVPDSRYPEEDDSLAD